MGERRDLEGEQGSWLPAWGRNSAVPPGSIGVRTRGNRTRAPGSSSRSRRQTGSNRPAAWRETPGERKWAQPATTKSRAPASLNSSKEESQRRPPGRALTWAEPTRGSNTARKSGLPQPWLSPGLNEQLCLSNPPSTPHGSRTLINDTTHFKAASVALTRESDPTEGLEGTLPRHLSVPAASLDVIKQPPSSCRLS